MISMIQKKLNSHCLIFTILLTGSGPALSADQNVITDDGREVLLKEDGSWTFRSTDRFANTSDGRRVKLKQDGSWEYIGKAIATAHTASAATPVNEPLSITIEKAVIEKFQKKVLKNIRINTQSVFYLKLALSGKANTSVSWSDKDITNIEVKDNKGRNYPVLAIQPDELSLQPNSTTNMMIRVDGSPSWWSKAKSVKIIFKQGLSGIKQAITLTQDVDDFEEVSVEGFEKTK